jgi:hypothetical protein
MLSIGKNFTDDFFTIAPRLGVAAIIDALPPSKFAVRRPLRQ